MASPRSIVANPNLEGTSADIARKFEEFYFHDVGDITAGSIMDPEQWAEGIQKLIEAKDCFVRSVLP